MSAIVVSAFVLGYLVGAGLFYGVALRLLPREGRYHAGNEDRFGRSCTGTASCEECKTNAAAMSVVWPVVVVGAPIVAVLYITACSLLWIAMLAARLTTPDSHHGEPK